MRTTLGLFGSSFAIFGGAGCAAIASFLWISRSLAGTRDNLNAAVGSLPASSDSFTLESDLVAPLLSCGGDGLVVFLLFRQIFRGVRGEAVALDRFLSLEIEPAAHQIFQAAVLEHAKTCRRVATGLPAAGAAGAVRLDPDRKSMNDGEEFSGGEDRRTAAGGGGGSGGSSTSTPSTAANSNAYASDHDDDEDSSDAGADVAAVALAARKAAGTAGAIDSASDASPAAARRRATKGEDQDPEAGKNFGLPRSGHGTGHRDGGWEDLPGSRYCRVEEAAPKRGENQDAAARTRLVAGRRDTKATAIALGSGLAEALSGGGREEPVAAGTGEAHGEDGADVKEKEEDLEEEDDERWDSPLPGRLVRNV